MAFNPILSKDFVLRYGGQVIAKCKDFTLDINKETIEVTTLDSDGWKQKLVDMKEWSASFNGLVARAVSGDVDIALSYWKAATTYADLDEVVFGGEIYVSDVASNLGNNPAEDSGANWDVKAAYAGGTTYDADELIVQTATVDGVSVSTIYISQQGSNTGNTPNVDDGTYWKAATLNFSYLLDELIGNDTAVEFALVLNSSADTYQYGDCYIVSLSLSGAVGDVSSYSGSLEGTGLLSIATVS